MSEDCILFQTEHFCVPTNWCFVDCGLDPKFKEELSSKITTELEYIPLISWINTTEFEDRSTIELDKVGGILKEKYVKEYRPVLLKNLVEALRKRNKIENNKGRLVVWFLGNIAKALHCVLLNELPFDFANLWYWKETFLPAVFRIGLDASDKKCKNLFLGLLKEQYFQIGGFTSKNDKLPRVLSNEYDSCLLFHSPSLFNTLLDKLLPLHKEETNYAKQHISHHTGSGGQLFPIEGDIVYIYSSSENLEANWRKLDWFCFTQYKFFPRLWEFKESDDLQSLVDLLDYSLCPLRKDPEKDDREATKQVLHQAIMRKREKEWKSSLTEGTPSLKHDLHETNVFRISPKDHRTRLELLRYLFKLNLFQESMEQIEVMKAEGCDVALFPDFARYEALVLIKLGNEEDSKKALKKYKECLLKDAEIQPYVDPHNPVELPKFLSTKELQSNLEKFTHIGNIFSEIASVCLKEKNYQQAIEFGIKSITFDPLQAQPYKTLIWASQRSGISSMQQEELIHHYFVRFRPPVASAENYYSQVTKTYPQVGSYHFYFGLFSWQTINKPSQAQKQFLQALKLLPDHDLVLGNYALFLHSQGLGTIEEIIGLFEKAIKIAPDNKFNLTNYAGFLLSKQNVHKKYKEEGVRILDKVLYSSDFIEKNPDLASECWFLALLYFPDRKRECLSNLKLALLLGGRSLDWDFGPHLRYVQEYRKKFPQSHDYVDMKWVAVLDKIISKGEDMTLLDEWGEWQNANDQIEFVLKYHSDQLPQRLPNPDPAIDLHNSANLFDSQSSSQEASPRKESNSTSEPASIFSFFSLNESPASSPSKSSSSNSSPSKSSSNRSSPSPSKTYATSPKKSSPSIKKLLNLDEKEEVVEEEEEEEIFKTPSPSIKTRKRKSPSSSPTKPSPPKEEVEKLQAEELERRKKQFQQISQFSLNSKK